MGDSEGAMELFVQVVKEFQQEKGRRPSAKELAKRTGLDAEDAQAILDEIPKEPAKKKQKTTPETEAPPAELAEASAPAAAEPSAPAAPSAELEDTLVDDPSHEDSPKEESKVDACKPDVKAEDAKSEAATQRYLEPATSALSPKTLANNQALASVKRGDSQRPAALNSAGLQPDLCTGRSIDTLLQGQALLKGKSQVFELQDSDEEEPGSQLLFALGILIHVYPCIALSLFMVVHGHVVQWHGGSCNFFHVMVVHVMS